MDCVVADSLDPLFDRADDLVLYASPPSPLPQPRPYNGSMLLMTAGARPQVYTQFTPERATLAGKHFLGSDQAWIAFSLGWGEKTWDERDGAVWFSPRYSMQPPECRVMFFPGNIKPWNTAGHRPLDHWVRRQYAPLKEAA
jgi:hypothetical protein